MYFILLGSSNVCSSKIDFKNRDLKKKQKIINFEETQIYLQKTKTSKNQLTFRSLSLLSIFNSKFSLFKTLQLFSFIHFLSNLEL